MDPRAKQGNGINYIDASRSDFLIDQEGSINELFSLCYDFETNIILLGDDNLSEAFFNLRSGLAGIAMQKCATYQAQVAVVLSEDRVYSDRFQELKYEMSASNNFRFFSDREIAVAWLTAKGEK